jgi:hypothetical protein
MTRKRLPVSAEHQNSIPVKSILKPILIFTKKPDSISVVQEFSVTQKKYLDGNTIF